MMQARTYIQKPLTVQAIQVTAENMVAIAEWCKGTINVARQAGRGSYIQVRAFKPQNARQTQAFVGDWVILSDSGFKVYNDKAFTKTFEILVQTEMDQVVRVLDETLAEASAKISRTGTDAEVVGRILERG